MNIAKDMPDDLAQAVAKVVREGRRYGVTVLVSSGDGGVRVVESADVEVNTTRNDGSNPISGPDAFQWIYPVPGGYTIAFHGAWLPGVYADLATARAAFDYDDDTLRLAAGDGTVPVTMQRLKSTIRPADPRYS